MKGTITLILFAVAGMINIIQAQDRHFVWTYESTTLPKGAIDIEPWVTYSSGRNNFYRKYESRLEFETGLTDKLQTAVYLNTSQESMALTDENGNVIGIGESTGLSFSNEWKLNLLDPSVNPFGVGVYGEYGISTDKLELEFKLLLDKRTPKSILAYNFVSEFEFAKEFQAGEAAIGTGKETGIENDLAYMYMFKPTLGLGVEAHNSNVIAGGKWEHSALYIGPSLFFSQKNFYAIVNALPQLGDLKNGGLELHDNTKFSGRIILGVSF